jgi:4-diphosphocytidyl-2-C-methyl-D-erythritol kinase
VLVNPGVGVATPAVFRGLERRDGTALDPVPGGASAAAFAGWLATQRNDLEAPARALAPEIGTVLAALGGTSGCLLARMSGSGATCFGLYADAGSAAEAARTLQMAQPGWWVASGRVLTANDQSTRATT